MCGTIPRDLKKSDDVDNIFHDIYPWEWEFDERFRFCLKPVENVPFLSLKLSTYMASQTYNHTLGHNQVTEKSQ